MERSDGVPGAAASTASRFGDLLAAAGAQGLDALHDRATKGLGPHVDLRADPLRGLERPLVNGGEGADHEDAGLPAR